MNGLAARRRTMDLPGKASQDLGEPSFSGGLDGLRQGSGSIFGTPRYGGAPWLEFTNEIAHAIGRLLDCNGAKVVKDTELARLYEVVVILKVCSRCRWSRVK